MDMARTIDRFDVYLIDLNPTLGSEISKIRPCVIVSPNQLNRSNMVIAVPMTSTRRYSSWRIPVVFNNVEGDAALDQIRAVDEERLIKYWGPLDQKIGYNLLKKLQSMFEI